MADVLRPAGALDDVRVLDLAGPIGWYATRLLADLGADVLRIEPPGGDPERRRPPYARGDDRASLRYWWFNAGKRSLVIDLERADGRSRLLELAAEADLLVETFPVGWLAERGLGLAELHRCNPRLVLVSITPFGQTGPRAAWRGTDLIGMATGGLVHLGGMPDRPPTHLGGEQGYLQAGIVAAAAALVALRDSRMRGVGRQVDVSLQDAIVFTTENNLALLDLMGHLRTRLGDRAFTGFSLFFPCDDGWLAFWPGGRFDGLLAWLEEMGVPTAPFEGGEWTDPAFRERHIPELTAAIRQAAAGKRKTLAADAAQAHRLAAAPVADVADLQRDPQLIARDFWVEVEHRLPAGETALVRYPGAPFKMSRTPWQIRRPAPAAGEHDTEGWRDRPALPRPRRPSRLPLEGIRVVDLTWQIAGPAATQVLADHGAEVLKIESAVHPDGLRVMALPRPPWTDSLNQSGIFTLMNTSKRSVTINMATEGGPALLRRLIALADVVVDNYGVDPLPKWGLTPDELMKIRPDLIVARSSVMGRSGPRSQYVGFGYTIGPAAGLNALSGFAGDPPVASCTAHPDYSCNSYHLLIAILAALHYRDRTGEGQLIDLSQHESTVVFNGPAILDYTVNGVVPRPSENRHPEAAPHGVYRCRGNDRWVAIACESDEDWQRLAHAIGRADLAADPALADLAGRQQAAGRIDAAIEAWTRLRRPAEAAEVLQAAGVPAGPVQTAADLFRDPHLAARGKILRLDHPELGRVRVNGPSFQLSGIGPEAVRRPPLLGEHTEAVLRDLLGLDEEELVAAYLGEVLQ
ncbi:MAG: CoA transferase [Chloroflexota bacterium]|nr:CoA transferase [Dehalococcoidia bacterium]MDW8253283.1 CoA transferase [Chloroflexota bacterium]